MLRTRSQPPSDDHLPHLPLKRLPTRAVWKLAITCTEMLQLDTHYMNRRTLPCIVDECPGCAAELPRRYEAYVSCLTTQPSTHIIVALTPKAAKQLWDSAPNPNDLRGLIITLQRLGNRANGPLSCVVDHSEAIAHKLPPIPELRAHMLKIWGLSHSHFGSDHPYYKQAADDSHNWSPGDHGS